MLLGAFTDDLTQGYFFKELPFPGQFTELSAPIYNENFDSVIFTTVIARPADLDPVPAPNSLALFAAGLLSLASFGLLRARQQKLSRAKNSSRYKDSR